MQDQGAGEVDFILRPLLRLKAAALSAWAHMASYVLSSQGGEEEEEREEDGERGGEVGWKEQGSQQSLLRGPLIPP